MKCLTKYAVQSLIDNELSTTEKLLAEKHIAECKTCRNAFYEQREFVTFFKTVSLAAQKTPEMIPTPVITLLKPQPIKRIPLWIKAAAVIIPVILIWQFFTAQATETKFTPTAKDILLYEMCNDIDANTAYQQKMVVLTYEDAEGNIEHITN